MSSENSETRQNILKATVRQLVEHGGKGVRMADIAKAAGISRQAVYLHFDSRSALLEATTKYLDKMLDLDKRLHPSRVAKTGTERVALYIEAWGGYIPEIYPVARALLQIKETDEAAAAAWDERMAAMKDGCRAAVEALSADGMLAKEWHPHSAIDMLWALLSVRNWELLTQDCGWTNAEYIEHIQKTALRMLVGQP